VVRILEGVSDHRRKLALLKELEPERSTEEHDAGNRTLRTFRERTPRRHQGRRRSANADGTRRSGGVDSRGVDLWLAATESALAREVVRLKDNQPPRTSA
jgi:hypothetical protein